MSVELGDDSRPYLPAADLRLTFFDRATQLEHVTLGNSLFGCVRVADTRWGEVNLTLVDWSGVSMLGDEREARKWKPAEPAPAVVTDDSATKSTPDVYIQVRPPDRLQAYQDAARANRQLATVLRTQGLTERADDFSYRAQVLQQHISWQRRNYGRWLFWGLLWLLSGYGYRLWRILAAYGGVVAAFALAYFLLGFVSSPHVTWYEALLASFTDIHGRVGVNTIFPLLSLQQWLAALESVIGIVIEGVFVAMLVQRFFGSR